MTANFRGTRRLMQIAFFALVTGCGTRVATEVAVDEIDVVEQPFPPNQ